jgi:methyl-accepting chemotaxis protein
MVLDEITLADIIANNSTAAITFNDSDSAEETLSELVTQPELITAVIYDKDQVPFAIYQRADQPASFAPPAPRPAGSYFAADHLTVSRQIKMEGVVIGSLTLECDLHLMNARQKSRLGIGGIAILISAFLVFLLTSKFQRLISNPIAALGRTARLVSVDKDYSLRAARPGNDELGLLVDSFNEMPR